MSEKARLAWQCRRGMRELDVLLTRFLEERYDELPAPDQSDFRRLLDQPNEDIMDWLFQRGQPADTGLRRIVEAVLDLPR